MVMAGVVGVLSSGCAKRVHVATVEKERIDQDSATGNKGFIAGTKPPSDAAGGHKTTRRIYQVTVEMPPYPEWKNFRFEPTEDKDMGGNRGYIYGGPQALGAPEQATAEPAIVLPEETSAVEMTEKPRQVTPVVAAVSEPSYTTYTVQKGDTLQKISEKVYGSMKQWKKIFDFNSDALKNPNKIYPGQKLKIPQR